MQSATPKRNQRKTSVHMRQMRYSYKGEKKMNAAQKTIDGKKPLECWEAYCKEQVIAFDTHHMTLFCKVHLKEMVLQSLKYHYNIHVEFIKDAGA